MSYPGLNKSLDDASLNNFVMKWTGWNEICSNRFYVAISNIFGKEKPLFHVPQSSAVDMKNEIHETVDGKHALIETNDVKLLKDKFSEIAALGNPDVTPKDSQVMLSERISGENLFDFARSKYKFLTSAQKQIFFEQLGQLAMLDLILGNHDRLLSVLYRENDQKYTVEDFECNLGNVMFQWSLTAEDLPVLCAIDNGIQPELIDQKDRREGYVAFLKQQLSDSNLETRLAKCMQGSILTALSNQAEDDESNPMEIKKELELFSTDVAKIAELPFTKGLNAMSSKLRDTLIPAWDSPLSDSLKHYLSWTHPELLAAVSERFNAFKQVRSCS